MILTSNEVVQRYQISYATLKNRKPIIQKAGGIDTLGGRGKTTLYKQEVLDSLALERKLGNKARKAIKQLTTND